MRSALAAFFAIMGTAAMPAPTIQYAVVEKTNVYKQTSAADVAPDPFPWQVQANVPLSGPYWFQARVVGQDLSSLSPAPSVSGPFDASTPGTFNNGGVLVYDPQSGYLRFGYPYGNDVGFPTPEARDANFGDGTYTFNVNGAVLHLTGAAYPNAPVMTFSQGSWGDGKFHFDPTQPLTITTNSFVGHTSKDWLDLDAYAGYTQVHDEADYVSITIPANAFAAGDEKGIEARFHKFSDNNPLGSGNFAIYSAVTRLNMKADAAASAPQVFPMTVTSNITPTSVTVQATFQPRPEDVGTTQSVFVFFVAPSNLVQGASLAKSSVTPIAPKNVPKDSEPVQCVLAQLGAGGALVGVTPSTLTPLLTDLLGAQSRAVTMLQNVQPDKIAGATSMLGYGANGESMYDKGTNQSAITIPGTVTCRPQRPQKGWWWNPKEDGRGYSIETVGNHFFFASFLYDVNGRATWYVATGDGATLDGSLISRRSLLAAHGGQTLGGSYPGLPTLTNAGDITLAFSDASNGTLVWPGGTVPIQRFNIVANGTQMNPLPNQPESGWWWNPDENGRGFFLEWQGGVLDIAGYMYDDNGDPIWYLTENLTPSTNLQQFSSNWWQYADGMTLMGPWKPNRQVTDHVAPVAIQFTGVDTAIMTLPNGRTTQLVRQRF